MGVLSGKGVELILRAGAHPGVGRHPQLSIPDWGAGRDGDHPGRAVQCQGTTGFLLPVHEIASCQQHTIPAHPQNIHIQTQQKSGRKYDVRPGLYTEPGRGPPGLLPTNKAGILEVMKEVHHPDIVNVVVHFISPFSNGGRYEAYGRRTAPSNSLKNTFRWLALFDTTSRALGGSRRTVLAHITGISPLRGSLRAAPIA